MQKLAYLFARIVILCVKNAIIQKKITSMLVITPVNGVGSVSQCGNGTLNRGIKNKKVVKLFLFLDWLTPIRLLSLTAVLVKFFKTSHRKTICLKQTNDTTIHTKPIPYVAKSFKCVDIGMKCGWSTRALSLRNLMDKILIHMEQDHGIQALSYDLKKKIEKAAKEESFYANYSKK